MQYRQLGKTGKKVSILGFGTMRLPVIENKEERVNEKQAVAIIREGIDKGINVIDTAYPYHGKNSELVVGQALKDGYREKVYLSTKLPIFLTKEPADFEKFLDEQLKKLAVENIDFYFFHALNKKRFEDIVLKFGLIEKAQKAKKEGKIKHLCFSFHDKPEVLKTIIDTDVFEAMLVQYNLLDQSNAQMMEYAKSKDMGVLVMGPIGGGRLQEPVSEVKEKMEEQGRQTFNPEMALRFVWSNPNVDVALSGMGNREMVERNIKAAANFTPYSAKELAQLQDMVTEYNALSNLYCSGCKYCLPCPQEVNIPLCFEMMNYHKVYGAQEYAKKMYKNIGKLVFLPGKGASRCIECGICEQKCPQRIPIREQLKEVQEIFGS